MKVYLRLLFVCGILLIGLSLSNERRKGSGIQKSDLPGIENTQIQPGLLPVDICVQPDNNHLSITAREHIPVLPEQSQKEDLIAGQVKRVFSDAELSYSNRKPGKFIKTMGKHRLNKDPEDPSLT